MSFPNLDSLASCVVEFSGKTGFIVEYDGSSPLSMANNGDRLIDEVFRRALSDLGIDLTPSVADADFMIVRPGGALLEKYRAPTMLLNRLKSLPDLPLVIFPSSSWFPRLDPSEIFSGRASETLWILRERYSYDHLSTRWGGQLAKAKVRLALDHDIVVSGHKYLSHIFDVSARSAECNLVAARLDGERRGLIDAEAPSTSMSWLRRIYSPLPVALKRPIKRTFGRTAQRDANAELLDAVSKLAQLDGGTFTGLDLSDPLLASYHQYRMAIQRSKTVITNRLHVGLPAALLGAETYLVEAGYHKLRGVYEHSLMNAQNVYLVVI